MGSVSGAGIGWMIISIIALVIGMNLSPTVAAQTVTVLKDVGASEALTTTVLRFLPVGFAVLLLGQSFAISMWVGRGYRESASPGYLIIAVIALVIGISLVATVSGAQVALINSVTQAATACAGSTACTAAATGTFVGSVDVDSAAEGVRISSLLTLTKTVGGFITVGYVVALLAAVFAMGNVGTGGRLSMAAGAAYGRARARF